MSRLADTLDVVAVAGINPNLFTPTNEEGHCCDCPGLEGRRLASRRGIALVVRFSFRDRQLDSRRQRHIQDLVTIEQEFELLALAHILRGIADDISLHLRLLVGLLIHEMELVAVAVEEGYLFVFEACLLEALPGHHRLDRRRACTHISQREPYECSPASLLDVVVL